MAAVLNSSACSSRCTVSLKNNNCSGNVPGNVVSGCTNANGNTCRFDNNPNLCLPFDVYLASRNWGGAIWYNGYGGDFGMSFSAGNLSVAVAGWATANPPLTQISVANYPSNILAGTLPASLNALTAVAFLQFDGSTGISGTIPDLTGMTSLNVFKMNGLSSVTGTLPSTLCSMTAMYDLELSSTGINGSLPACVATAMASGPLRSINVASTNMAGVIPAAIATLCSSSYMGYGCNFGGTSLTLPPSPDVSQIQTAITSLNATLAGVTAALAALQVNLSAATAACSAG